MGQWLRKAHYFVASQKSLVVVVEHGVCQVFHLRASLGLSFPSPVTSDHVWNPYINVLNRFLLDGSGFVGAPPSNSPLWSFRRGALWSVVPMSPGDNSSPGGYRAHLAVRRVLAGNMHLSGGRSQGECCRS